MRGKTNLSNEQKRLLDILLEEKDTLLQKRRYNRNQLDKLRAWYKTEKDKKLKVEIRGDISIGLRLVDKQTKEISALSFAKIAQKLETSLHSVMYYSTANYEVRF